MAYGDVNAAMNALPRSGETLNEAWTRQDLLYESDTEALSTNPSSLSKKDSEPRRLLCNVDEDLRRVVFLFLFFVFVFRLVLPLSRDAAKWLLNSGRLCRMGTGGERKGGGLF